MGGVHAGNAHGRLGASRSSQSHTRELDDDQTPAPFLLFKYGARLRRKSQYADQTR
jgi:hypothetical protein